MKYIIAILLILFASFADIFLFRIGIIPVQPSEFLIPLFLGICIIKYPVMDLLDIVKSHTFRLFAALLFLVLVYSAKSPVSTDLIITEIVLNVFTLVMYVYIVHFFRTESRGLVFFTVLLCFSVLAISVWYDYLVGLPKFTKSLEAMVRKGGFGENPNQAATAMKFLALCVLVFLEKYKSKRTLFIVVMVLSVFMTFSRSGIISVVLILIFGIANGWSSKFKITSSMLFKSSFKMIFLFTMLYVGLVFFAGILKSNFPELARGGMADRIDLLLGKSEGSLIAEDVGGGGGRGDLLLQYLDKFMKNPMGYGTAYTAEHNSIELNTHNYYLYIAVNLGFIALLIYLIYLFVGVKLSFKHDQFYYLIFVVLLMFQGLISHYIFYNRSMLISVAFLDSLIYRKILEQTS